MNGGEPSTRSKKAKWREETNHAEAGEKGRREEKTKLGHEEIVRFHGTTIYEAGQGL